MLKYFNIVILFVILSVVEVCGQPAKATFVYNNGSEIEVDQNKYIIWHGYVIDSVWWHVWLPNGDLPRRENGTYLYWKADENGDLIPLRKIDYRLPIFRDDPIVINKEKNLFE